MKKQTKSSVKNSSKEKVELIHSLIKDMKISAKVNSTGVTLTEQNLSIYFDTISDKYCILSIKSGTDVFSTKAISQIENYLNKNIFNKAEKIEEAKMAKSAKTKTAKTKTAKTKVDAVAKSRKEIIVVEDVKVVKKSLLEEASRPVELIQLKDMKNKMVEGFRGVYDNKLKETVSVVSDTYNLLPNKSVIDPVLSYLDKQKIKYNFDRFSYVSPQRMRLHFTFPDLKIKDDTKEGILGSIFLHNSYNSTEAYKMLAGGVRQVCANGMIIGTVMSKLRVIHQAHEIETIAIANLESVFEGFYNNAKLVEARIKEMIQEKVTVKTLLDISKKVELRIFAHIMRELGLLSDEQKNSEAIQMLKDLNEKQVLAQNLWALYNMFTRFISHQTLQRYRLEYLQVVSKHFQM